MAQDQATFEFPTFKVHVQAAGHEGDAPVYETDIVVPGHESIQSGTLLKGAPLLSSAALAAVSEIRRLLRAGVKAFVDEFRSRRRGISFKETQEVRLKFLSWYDVGTVIGDEALASAQENLKAREPEEYRQTFGREPEEEEGPVADFRYDLGPLLIHVAMMGLLENAPIWVVTARAEGTDLYANTIIGVQSPLALDAAVGMVENLLNVLRLGIDPYLAEQSKAKRTPIPPEKRIGTEMLYDVASYLGLDRLEAAGKRLDEMREEYIDSLQDQATADMEAQIAEYRKRKPKT